MALQILIARYGLLAVLAGAAIEGETAVVAGGILAHQSILSLPAVVVAGALGSFAADQAFFSLGRHYRDHPRVERILAKPAAEKVLARLKRYPTTFILGFRFLYGLRTVSPVAVGTSDVGRTRFLLLNALAAMLWAGLFTGIGYALGGPLRRYFHDPSSLIPAVVGTWLAVGLAIFIVPMVWRRIRRAK